MNFAKMADGLLPAVVQDAATRQVLMVGYMNAEALELTRQSGQVTFFSRSRQRLWTKGEISGNSLRVQEIFGDCDADALLILALPAGPTCHTGAVSCFAPLEPQPPPPAPARDLAFLGSLEAVIAQRVRERPEGSYIAKLLTKGLDRVAQKLGEEAVETVIASKNPDQQTFESEGADLLFHLMILLELRGSSLGRLAAVLESRQR